MIVSDIYPGLQRLLVGRTVSQAIMAENIRKGILELTEDYKFQGLQETGPTISLVPYQANYDPDFFLNTDDSSLEVTKVDSFWIYNNPFQAPSSTNLLTNSGYDLKFRTINDIEVLINIPGLPLYWTRWHSQIWLGDMPDQPYNMYMRYQKEHPFPGAGTPAAGDDPILLSVTWQDIVEYVGAMRCARELNLSNKANELKTALYGDRDFQTSGGVAGSPGLIFKRTSQQERDQTTSTKQLRLRMGSR